MWGTRLVFGWVDVGERGVWRGERGERGEGEGGGGSSNPEGIDWGGGGGGGAKMPHLAPAAWNNSAHSSGSNNSAVKLGAKSGYVNSSG